MIANPTSSAPDAVRRPERQAETWARAAAVVLASFAIGMLTFFAQGILPDALTSFANSASGWTLVTVLLLAWARASTPLAAALGAVGFIVLTVGYSASAHLHGLFYDPTVFVVVGVVVGPFVGVATSWLRAGSEWRATAGTALLAGIGLGEAFYGLTAVAETTSPVYWSTIGVVALGLLAAMLVRRIRSTLARGAAVVGAAAVAGAFLAAYSALGATSFS